MKVNNIALRLFKEVEPTETFGDYDLERKLNPIRSISRHILDQMGYEEVGDDKCRFRFEGEMLEASKSNGIRDFLTSYSRFDLDGILLNLSHDLAAREAYGKNPGYRPTAVAVPFNKDNEILLVNKGFGNWSLPQGGMLSESDGSFKNAVASLKDELAEEVSLKSDYQVYPTTSCVRTFINFNRELKVDKFDNGNEMIWEGKQYHFYAVFIDGDLSRIKINDGEMTECGFFSLNDEEFETMSDFKQDAAEEVLRQIEVYRQSAVEVS